MYIWNFSFQAYLAYPIPHCHTMDPSVNDAEYVAYSGALVEDRPMTPRLR